MPSLKMLKMTISYHNGNTIYQIAGATTLQCHGSDQLDEKCLLKTNFLIIKYI